MYFTATKKKSWLRRGAPAQQIHPGTLCVQRLSAEYHQKERQRADKLEEEPVERHLAGRHGLECRHVFGDCIHRRQHEHGARHQGHALERILVFRGFRIGEILHSVQWAIPKVARLVKGIWRQDQCCHSPSQTLHPAIHQLPFGWKPDSARQEPGTADQRPGMRRIAPWLCGKSPTTGKYRLFEKLVGFGPKTPNSGYLQRTLRFCVSPSADRSHGEAVRRRRRRKAWRIR